MTDYLRINEQPSIFSLNIDFYLLSMVNIEEIEKELSYSDGNIFSTIQWMFLRETSGLFRSQTIFNDWIKKTTVFNFPKSEIDHETIVYNFYKFTGTPHNQIEEILKYTSASETFYCLVYNSFRRLMNV